MKHETGKISKGTTLTELLVAIAILIVLAAVSIPVIYNFYKEADLQDIPAAIINNLKLAQSRTLASEASSQWGVYFDDSLNPHQYVLFKGTSYALRETSFDEVYKLPREFEFFNINLAGTQEVVFYKINGTANPFGNVSIRLKDNPLKSNTIYIESSGLIAGSVSVVSDSSRLRDSRHTHFDYSRIIDTATESIVLNFNGGTTETIVLINNMSGGQIDWQGEVDVDGQTQVLKIHTHRLNNPDTQFCIHRDRRYNSKALNIDISGDPSASPDLIRYEIDDSVVQGNSAFVSEPICQ